MQYDKEFHIVWWTFASNISEVFLEITFVRKIHHVGSYCLSSIINDYPIVLKI